MTHTDTLNLTVTRAQAERLLALVDAENSAQKNRCASTLAATADCNLTADDERRAERIERAVKLALDSEYLTALRANLARRLDNSLAR
jgi:hypothetical protein